MAADPRPIRLIYCDEQGVFRMDREAVSILQLVKGPIGVVSVCGPGLQGKSYISNQLLERTSGFKLRSSALRRCTKGLWMWSSPSRKTAADGTEYDILVVDMEGINGCAQGQEYFYLAVVLSSILLYNEMGHLDESSFYCLSLLTNMNDTTVVDTKSFELGLFSPIFVWILRDFSENLVRMSPSEYMESALKVADNPDDVELVRNANKVRKSMQAVFTNRHCFTLVRPLHEEKELRFLTKYLYMDRLKPEFKKGMNEVRSFVFEKTKPKKIGATVMTGPIIVQITQYILEAFNNGTWPSMASIWENLQKTNHLKALNSATTAIIFGDPPAANTRQRKRSIAQRM